MRERRVRRSRCPAATRRPRPTAPAPTTTGASCSTPSSPKPAWLTGTQILPGNPEVVHHVILFQVPPEQVAAAEAKDAGRGRRGLDVLRRHRPRPLPERRPVAVDRRLGARRQGVGDQARLRHPSREGQPHRHAGPLQPARRAGARHLRRPAAPRARRTGTTRPSARCSCPRPSSCRAVRSTTTASSATATRPLADVKERFGAEGNTADLLHLLCGGKPKPGQTQSCLRTLSEPITIHGVAGHMHLLGRSIKIEVRPGHAAGADRPRHPGLGLRRPGQPADRADHPAAVRAGQGHLHPRPVAARQAAGLRGPARPLRRVGRGHHRRDVPRHAAGHPPLSRASTLTQVCPSPPAR